MVQIDVLAAQIAELRHAEPMIEREHEHGGIAPVVARVSGALEQDEKFRLGEIVAQALVRIDGSRAWETFHTRRSIPLHVRRPRFLKTSGWKVAR